MDADGSRSTDIARSLRKLGVKAEVPNPSPESVTPLNEKVDLSEA